MTEKDFTAFVSWPSAPLTNRLVRQSLSSLQIPLTIVDTLPSTQNQDLLQWSTYDAIDHELTRERSSAVLSSSYTIRKALIRKHYLSRSVHNYLVKQPESALKTSVPQTWDLELSFADELEDMWTDELWDLGEELDKGDKWFILKPGMADRGMGIRLFHTKDDLVKIFEDFEDQDSDEEADERSEDGRDTAVVTSQLRHFVVQEYLVNPLLLDPLEVPLDAKPQAVRPARENLRGHKFHLRAYCVASGALRVYLYSRILALFSALPYSEPCRDVDGVQMDLSAHLTNTSLQVERGEEGVRLFDELIGCHILNNSDSSAEDTLTEDDVEDIKVQMADVLSETFKAAMSMSVHFQPIPNAFELFGIDFLITRTPLEDVQPRRFQVSLLEVNSEPAIELTGPRLTWILEDLFKSIGQVCVAPFFRISNGEVHDAEDQWKVGQTKEYLRKCLDVDIRGAGGW